MQKEFDLIVIGAGPGGYVAALKAAQFGSSVALIEKDFLGGTCLNRGCIPTKTLVHSANILREIKKAGEYGISAENISCDIEKMHQKKQIIVERLRSGIALLLKNAGIEIFEDYGKIIEKNKVRLINRDIHIYGKNIIVATGSVPKRPNIQGISLPNVKTSDQLLELNDKIPNRLVIIGAGVIGCEFADIYNALGSQVALIEAMDRILPTAEKEICQNLSAVFKKQGIKINLSSKVNKIESNQEELTVFYEKNGKEQELKADVVLVAIGRSANIKNLFTQDLIELKNGSIKVDENFRTNIENIYAIGDVIFGGIQLAHVASAQAINVVNLIHNQNSPIDLNFVPNCVYTEPEIAWAGISQQEAEEKNIPIKIGKFQMSANGKTLISGAQRSFIKLIFCESDGILLGAQLMCKNATDMISELLYAIKNGLDYKQIISLMHPHPTFSEAIIESCENAFGTSIHTP